MLYRYPVEQKRTAQEITKGNKRYDTYTGDPLPPIPYVGEVPSAKSGGAGQNSAAVYTTAKNGAGSTTADIQNSHRREQLEKQYSQNRSRLKNNYNLQLAAEKMTNDEILRQLYIAYMKGIKNMPQQSVLWGAGGEIESLKSRHRINYENNRANQNAQYGSIISEIQQKYNDDLMALEEKYLSQLMGL